MPPSKIIKGEEFAEPAAERTPPPRMSRPGVVEAEVYEAHQKAKEVIELAERQAVQILEKAQREREGVVAAAQREGYEKGLAQATEILLRAKQEHADAIAATEPEVVKLALAIAERIVGRALQLDQELVLDITAQAIEAVRQQRELVLRVHPDDAQLLRNNRKKLMDMLGRSKEIAVREDPEVERGGCVVETEHGTVDAQLKTQLQMLETALLGPRSPDTRQA